MQDLVLIPLSQRQRTILELLYQFLEQKYYPPTNSEIQEAAGLKNPGLVFKVLVALERKGYIHRVKGKHRSIRLTDTGIRFISESRQPDLF